MRNFSPVALSLLIAACASATPPEPPLPITSHAFTAADYPVESIPLREVDTTQVQYLVHVDGTVRDTIDRNREPVALQTCYPKRPACPGLARRERPV